MLRAQQETNDRLRKLHEAMEHKDSNQQMQDIMGQFGDMVLPNETRNANSRTWEHERMRKRANARMFPHV